MRRLIIVAAVLAVAGCAKPLEVSSITEIQPPPGATGVDVYASRRAAGEKVPDFAGDQIVEVRTYKANDGGGTGDEIGGAQCKVSARDFSADATSPAKVRVPVYRAQSSPLAVKCEMPGYRPKLIEVGAYDVTNASRLQAGSGAGAVGILFMAAVNAASDQSTHDFSYPVAKLAMESAASPTPAAAARDPSLTKPLASN
jgi:hypothetical protein